MTIEVGQDEPPYIIAVHLRALFEYLQARGKPLAPVLEACGLSEADLADIDRRIDDEAEDRAFVAAEALCADPDIGLHVGTSVRPTHYGLLGHLLMTCANAGEMFALHMRYAQLVGNGMQANYLTQGDSVCLEITVPSARAPYHRHTTEYNLAGWITTARWLSGTELSPTRIELPHPRPASTQAQDALFRCELRFDADRLRLWLPVQYLGIPFLHGNTGLRQTLEAEAHKRLLALRIEQTDRNPLVSRIRQYVADHLERGVPDLQAAASALDLSVRSLQRQLDGLGTGYKDIVEQVRQQLAERYVHDQTLSLVDIALMLGFAEQSTFQRAFRRWFNMTPGEYRRRAPGG